jgi:hypothetical protein
VIVGSVTVAARWVNWTASVLVGTTRRRRPSSVTTNSNRFALPGVLAAVTHSVTEAIWFGLGDGYVTMTGGGYHIPRQFLSDGHGTML